MATNGSGAVNGVPVVNSEVCSGCGRCVAACPEKLITLKTSGFRKHAMIRHPERCNSCGRCIEACPIAALSF